MKYNRRLFLISVCMFVMTSCFRKERKHLIFNRADMTLKAIENDFRVSSVLITIHNDTLFYKEFSEKESVLNLMSIDSSFARLKRESVPNNYDRECNLEIDAVDDDNEQYHFLFHFDLEKNNIDTLRSEGRV